MRTTTKLALSLVTAFAAACTITPMGVTASTTPAAGSAASAGSDAAPTPANDTAATPANDTGSAAQPTADAGSADASPQQPRRRLRPRPRMR